MKTKTLEAAKENYEELLYRYARYLLRTKGAALYYVEEVFKNTATVSSCMAVAYSVNGSGKGCWGNVRNGFSGRRK